MQAALQLGITAEPTGGTRDQAVEVDAPGPEGDGHAAPRPGVHPHQPSPHLLRRLQGVAAGALQHHAIAGFEGLVGAQHQHAPRFQLLQPPHQGATLFAPAPLNQALVVDALKPTRAESAGEAEFQLATQVGLRLSIEPVGVVLLQAQLVEAHAVGLGDGGHIGRVLEPAFDFEARHAGLVELGQQLPRGQILGGEQIAPVVEIARLTIHHQLIGQPAGLGTFAAVGTALPQGFAGEALPGIGHAQGPMHKHLQGHGEPPLVELPLEALQIPQAKLPRQHHPHGPQFGRHRHAGGAGDRHLGGAMHRQARCQLGRQHRQADVLHDQRIDAGGGRRQQQLGRIREFMGEHQHVHREEALDATAVQPGHHLRQVVEAEVLRPQARIEAIHAEIHGIGPVGHGSPQGSPAARRGQQLGQGRHQRSNRCAASNTFRASAEPSNRQCQGS